MALKWHTKGEARISLLEVRNGDDGLHRLDRRNKYVHKRGVTCMAWSFLMQITTPLVPSYLALVASTTTQMNSDNSISFGRHMGMSKINTSHPSL